MEKWRYIVEDGVDAAYGLAADEYLLKQASRGHAALRLYTYHSHCALIGLFQCLSAEVDLDVCSDFGIQLGRRPTGGGAIIMGAGQLGIAAAVPDQGGAAFDMSVAARCHSSVIGGLARLGMEAQFRPKNDIVVAGRKICGTGALRGNGAVLYHASVLLDFDAALMRKVLKSASIERSGDTSDELLQRLSSVRREVSPALSMRELRECIALGFRDKLRISLAPERLTDDELFCVRQIENERYAKPEWIDSVRPGRDVTAYSELKTPGGLVKTHVALSGETIKSVLFEGDFFGERSTLNAVEAALKWTPAEGKAIGEAIRNALRRSGGSLSVPLGYLSQAVLDALAGDGVCRKSSTS